MRIVLFVLTVIATGRAMRHGALKLKLVQRNGGDDYFFCRPARVATGTFYLLNDFFSSSNLTKYDMLAVQPGGVSSCNIKLGSIGVWAWVSWGVPEFAIAMTKGWCLMVKFSSSNFLPCMDTDPVPSPLTMSPPCMGGGVPVS